MKLAVVVPAYNEERLIRDVLETMPAIVDYIIVVDDASTDRTAEIVSSLGCSPNFSLEERITLLRLAKNQGVGGAIMAGHRVAIEQGLDIVAVMAGDGQMNPAELEAIIAPILRGEADYCKGNRFLSGLTWQNMPKVRFFGNAGLSMLNKIASGYWHISDPQCGYTAITLATLKRLDFNRLSKRYQFENSMLIELNILNCRVQDVPVEPIYSNGQKSGFNAFVAALPFLLYLLKAFIYRLWHKYVIRDFHPLVLFYACGIFLLLSGGLFGVYLLAHRVLVGMVSPTSAMFSMMMVISGLQLILQAMQLDKEYN